MFHKASLFTAAVALLASASPITQDSGIHISLPPRDTLTKPDGTFDHDKAATNMARTFNKHQLNLRAIQRNTGNLSAFHPGAQIKPLASIPAPAPVRKRQSAEQLSDEQNGREWAGSVAIGTPAQTFVIDFDTGSGDLWVPSSQCTSAECSGKHTYDAAASSTGRLQSGTFQTHYGDGSSVSGPIYTDTVSVAGVQASNQYFAAATTLSDSFGSNPIDGIMGMAFEGLSQLQQNPWFVSAYAQGALPANLFAFQLSARSSTLTLGGTNSSLYTGAPEPHAVSSSAYWELAGASALVGAAAVSGFATVVDTGTTGLVGPPDAVKEFYARVPGAAVHDQAAGTWTFPCASTPEVAFSWGGQAWAISEENFNLGQASYGSDQCIGALIGLDVGLGDNVWILGDSFMKNVYTVFSFADNSISFAALS